MEKTNRKLTMKLTKTKLKQLIKEELQKLNEDDDSCEPGTTFSKGDGCNTCTCPDSGKKSEAKCTEKACGDADDFGKFNESASFNPTDEFKKDFMDPAINELSETLKSEQLQHALENVAISVIDQYTDAEEYEDQEPGSREEKYGKMTANEAREEIALAIDAVFDDFLEDFFFGTVEQLISETFPDDSGDNSDELYAQYTDDSSTTLNHPTGESHERMKQIARKLR